MALKMVDGKEMRVPGGAIPEGQRRQGALGKLDGMGLREFQKLPLLEREGLLSGAKKEKMEANLKALLAECEKHLGALRAHDRLADMHIKAKTITEWGQPIQWFEDPDHPIYQFSSTYLSLPTFNYRSAELWDKSIALMGRLEDMKKNGQVRLGEIDAMLKELKAAMPGTIQPHRG